MKNLILICGFSCSTLAENLASYLNKIFEKENNQVLKLWIDPNRESRAVALFDKELGMANNDFDLIFIPLKVNFSNSCNKLEC